MNSDFEHNVMDTSSVNVDEAFVPQRTKQENSNTEQQNVHPEAMTQDTIVKLRPSEGSSKTVTNFVDTSKITVENSRNNMHTLPIQPFPDISLKDFLQRPYPLAAYEWTSTSALEIYTPWETLLGLQPVICKAQNFAYMKAKMRISFKINGTGQHYGRLIAFWVPLGAGTISVFTTNNTSLHHITLSPTSSDTQEMMIPFIYPEYYYPLGALNGRSDLPDPYDYGKIYLYPLVPLQTVGSTIPTVNITIWANFEEIELMGPIEEFNEDVTKAKQVIAARKRKKESKYSTLPYVATPHSFEGFLKSAANVVEGIPKTIAKVATSVEPVLDVGASVARGAMLLDKPNDCQASQHVRLEYPDVTHVEGLSDVKSLGLRQANCVQPAYDLTGGSPNDMDISHVIQTPGVLDIISFTSTDVPGNMLAAYPMSPATAKWDVSSTNFISQPTFLSDMAVLFKNWRGSLRFKFDIVSSAFHSGRLRIFFSPGTVVNTTLTFDEIAQSSNTVNAIVDVKTDSELSLAVPWVMSKPLLNTDWSPLNQDWSFGTLYVQVVNPLSSVQTPVNPVNIIVWVSAGSDFQFVYPQLESTLLLKNREKFTVKKRVRGIPHGGSDTVRNAPYETMIKGVGFRDHDISSQLSVTSVKELLFRGAPLGSSFLTGDQLYDPFYNGTSATPFTFLTIIREWYLATRGGRVLKFIPVTTAYGNIVYDRTSNRTNYMASTSTSMEDDLLQFGSGAVVATHSTQVLGAHVPWISNKTFAFANSGLHLDLNAINDAQMPVARIHPNSSSASFYVLEHAADDCVFAYLLQPISLYASVYGPSP